MKEGWNVIIKHSPEWNGVKVWLAYRSGNKETVVKPIDLTMTTILDASDAREPEPTLLFTGHDSVQFLQELADALVEAGFKPDAIKMADERVVAMQAHLDDMRRLVFDGLLPNVLPPKLPIEDKK